MVDKLDELLEHYVEEGQRGFGLLSAITISVCVTLLTSCGGASTSEQTSIQAAHMANPLGGSSMSVASSEAAGSLPRMKALGVALTTPNPTADQLLNWAELNFPQYFPSHSTTLTEGPWVYRSYMQTGILLGVNAGDVYVIGGEFGGQLIKVGKVSEFVKPAILVKRSSYENKMMAGEITGSIVKPWPKARIIVSEEITGGIAFGDFFQEGSFSIVAFSNTFNNPTGPATMPGRAYFFKLESGKWVDRTSVLLSDQTGCISPRKVLVADFNGDGKPDVFASCTGYDGPIDGKLPGEHPRILLSQTNGTYKNVPFPLVCYCHGSAAADMRGDGFADIILQDNAVEGVTYFVNGGDGTFSMDRSRVPVSARRFGISSEYTRQIWTVELVDFWGVGKYDLFLGGVDRIDCCNWKSKIYKNSGSNSWTDDLAIALPSLPGRAVDVYDMLSVNGNIYLLRNGPADSLEELSMAIQRINIASLESSVAYSHTGPFSNGYSTMIEWIIYHDGEIKNLYSYPDVTTGL